MQQTAGLYIPDAHLASRVAGWLRRRGLRVEEGPPVGARTDVLVVACWGVEASGLDGIRSAALDPERPAILAVCPAGATALGVAALQAGADAYLLEPVSRAELEIQLSRALELRGLRRVSIVARGGCAVSPMIMGHSPVMRAVRQQIERVAVGRATVLLTGETGTGKELVATAIQQSSTRHDRPYIKVNCAALPDSLLESELFGHERGAFTGAERRRIGRFEEAHHGTLFMDEIGDMHPRTQAKVLRALQEQEFERVGGHERIRVDVRIMAATNQDLRAAIERGSFRQDLLFRLDVVSIHLPALRERPLDIPLLSDAFLAEFNAGTLTPKLGIDGDAMEVLVKYPWPGNVRELRNTIERAVLMGERPRITPCDLALPEVPEVPPPARVPTGPHPAPRLARLPEAGVDLREVERELILQALERSGWVQKRAAELLQMSRRKLNYRIRRLGITHPSWPRNRPS